MRISIFSAVLSCVSLIETTTTLPRHLERDDLAHTLTFNATSNNTSNTTANTTSTDLETRGDRPSGHTFHIAVSRFKRARCDATESTFIKRDQIYPGVCKSYKRRHAMNMMAFKMPNNSVHRCNITVYEAMECNDRVVAQFTEADDNQCLLVPNGHSIVATCAKQW